MRTPPYRYFWIFGLVLRVTFSAAAQTWRQVGPPGGDVQSLAAVPGGTRTLFLGTSDGHVFGSRDAGEHWELLGRIGANHDDVIMSIVVDARSAGTLYATSWTLNSHGGGVYRSADAGHNWELIGLEGHAVRALASAPSNPNILIAGAIDGVYWSATPGRTGSAFPRRITRICATSIPSRLTRTTPTQFTPARITCRGKPWTAEKAGRRFIKAWWTIRTS